jgi:ferric-dicitrate binding protein FerR (iron transport regulator)
MTISHADAARRAAARLAPDLGSDLPALTERALAGQERTAPRRSYDAGASLAVAALLVSLAQFGWQIYRDLKEDREKREETDRRQTLQVLIRRMRLSLDAPQGLSVQQRDRLLEVVAEEILISGEPPCPPA